MNETHLRQKNLTKHELATCIIANVFKTSAKVQTTTVVMLLLSLNCRLKVHLPMLPSLNFILLILLCTNHDLNMAMHISSLL